MLDVGGGGGAGVPGAADGAGAAYPTVTSIGLPGVAAVRSRFGNVTDGQRGRAVRRSGSGAARRARGLLTGCGAAPRSADVTVSGRGSGKVAESAGTVGGTGSACALPVAFDVALVCELDATPTVAIGFLRVSAGQPGSGDARTVPRAFVTAEGDTDRAVYRTFGSGGLSGVRVDCVHRVRLLGERTKEPALAVVTPRGPVVPHLGGLDSAEHDEMRPAFELAQATLRTAWTWPGGAVRRSSAWCATAARTRRPAAACRRRRATGWRRSRRGRPGPPGAVSGGRPGRPWTGTPDPPVRLRRRRGWWWSRAAVSAG